MAEDRDVDEQLSEEAKEKMMIENEKSKPKSGSFFRSLMNFFRALKPGEVTPGTELNVDMVESQSGLEFWRTCSMKHVDILVEASKQQDPVDRAAMIAKYLISAVRLTPGSKKPLNPILGELALGKVKHGDSETICMGEQTSHHPPISSAILRNKKHGITYETHAGGKVWFTGVALHIKFEGTRTITLEKFGETYEITAPVLVIRIFRGAIEFNGEATVHCEKTGVSAKIKYKAKPIFGGSWNAIEGKVLDSNGKTQYEMDGNWDSVVNIKNLRTNKTEEWTVDSNSQKIEYPTKLDDRASELVWKDLKEAADKGDGTAMAAAKHKVEEDQRARKKEKTDFQIRFFTGNDKDGFKWNGQFPTWDGAAMDS